MHIAIAALVFGVLAGHPNAPHPYSVQGVPEEAAWALGYRHYPGHDGGDDEDRPRRRGASKKAAAKPKSPGPAPGSPAPASAAPGAPAGEPPGGPPGPHAEPGGAHAEPPGGPVVPPLYERIGMSMGIGLVVNKFVERVSADARVNKRFRKVDLEKFKQHLALFVANRAGGPESYEGKDMKAVHAGMKISDAEFDAVVEDLIGALNDVKMPEREKGEFMAMLAPLRADIVEVR